MNNSESHIVDTIKKLYDVEVNSTYFALNAATVKVYVDFIPKEITTMTPDEARSYGKWFYYPDTNKLSWEDFTYIRKGDMPILNYTQGEFYLDNYCEKLAYEELNRVLRENGFDVEFNP